MRFAGQRFRAGSGYVGDFRQPRERADLGRSPYSNPSGVKAMTNMNEINAGSFTKTAQSDMSDSPFNFPEIQQPEFRSPRRV